MGVRELLGRLKLISITCGDCPLLTLQYTQEVYQINNGWSKELFLVGPISYLTKQDAGNGTEQKTIILFLLYFTSMVLKRKEIFVFCPFQVTSSKLHRDT